MKQTNTSIVITAIIAGAVLILVGLALVLYQPTSVNQKDSVTVQGVSSIEVTPDLVSVYYTIETKGDTSAEAKDANQVIYDKLVTALLLEGFSRDEIQTQNYNIYPVVVYDNGKQSQDGYMASHSVKVSLPYDKFTEVDGLIDAGVDSGAGVSYIAFELTQESQSTAKAEALALAAEDAQRKAEAVAEGFDKRVGSLLSVQVSDFGYYPWTVYASSSDSVSEDAALAREAVATITPSDREVSATVSATFQLR